MKLTEIANPNHLFSNLKQKKLKQPMAIRAFRKLNKMIFPKAKLLILRVNKYNGSIFLIAIIFPDNKLLK